MFLYVTVEFLTLSNIIIFNLWHYQTCAHIFNLWHYQYHNLVYKKNENIKHHNVQNNQKARLSKILITEKNKLSLKVVLFAQRHITDTLQIKYSPKGFHMPFQDIICKELNHMVQKKLNPILIRQLLMHA